MLKIAAFLAAATFSTAALADTAPLTATLKSAPKTWDVVTGGVIWDCKANVCTAASDVSGLNTADICGGLARKFGEVTKFEGLSAEGLAACNTLAKK
jgi:hypothetical protein